MFLFLDFVFCILSLSVSVKFYERFGNVCDCAQVGEPALGNVVERDAQALEERLLVRHKSAFSDTEVNENEKESDSDLEELIETKPPLSAQTSRHQRVGSYRPMMVRGGYFVDEVPQSIAQKVDNEYIENNNNNTNDNENEQNSENDDKSEISVLEEAQVVADPAKLNLLIADYKNDTNYDSGPSNMSISQSPTQTVSFAFALYSCFLIILVILLTVKTVNKQINLLIGTTKGP